MGLNGISMGFLWVLTGFLWDLANNNGDLMKFNENIPSSYQPWQLEIPLFNPSFHEKHPEMGDIPWPWPRFPNIILMVGDNQPSQNLFKKKTEKSPVVFPAWEGSEVTLLPQNEHQPA